MYRKSEIVDDSLTYKVDTIKALRRFKDLKTFQPDVTLEQRLAALQVLVDDLIQVYELDVKIPIVRNRYEMGSTYDAEGQPIIPLWMDSRSIITLLYRFAEIRGRVSDFEEGHSHLERQRWAVNLFRKLYPKQFAKLAFNEHDASFHQPHPDSEWAESEEVDQYAQEEDDELEYQEEAPVEMDPVESELRSALRRAEGVQSRAAEFLGVSRSTVRRRIERFGINVDDYRE